MSQGAGSGQFESAIHLSFPIALAAEFSSLLMTRPYLYFHQQCTHVPAKPPLAWGGFASLFNLSHSGG